MPPCRDVRDRVPCPGTRGGHPPSREHRLVSLAGARIVAHRVAVCQWVKNDC